MLENKNEGGKAVEEERYPVGEFQFEGEFTSEVIKGWIDEIEKLPRLLKEAVEDLSEDQLDTSYRAGGWTVRQVVHHLSDSHMNAYIRLKLALTEDNPVIKPYNEGKWAELPDSNLPIASSLSLLDSIHIRWVTILHSLTSVESRRTFIHPDSGQIVVKEYIGMYAWHGRHHLAHITSLFSRKGWKN